MTKLRSLAAFLAAVAAALLAGPVFAAQTTCYVAGTSPSVQASYDPFDPVGLPTTTVSMVVTRMNSAGGGDPRIVNMYLTGPAASNGTQVVVQSVAPYGSGSVSYEGTGLDIYYDTNETKPAVLPITNSPSSSARFLKINFTGNNADSDRAIVTFQVTLPANLDLSAGGNIAFDGNYGCFIRGGSGNGVSSESFFGNAIVFSITVKSALQAGYAGTDLDFGEIGDITTASLSTSPKRTATGNYVRVQSSGPYQISLSSAGGYMMTPAGASTTDTLQQVRYELKFLGQTRTSTNTGPISFVCPRAGVGTSAEDKLNIQAQLAEGGTGKTVSPNYRDTLTVTIAPQAAGTATTSGSDCDQLSGTF